MVCGPFLVLGLTKVDKNRPSARRLAAIARHSVLPFFTLNRVPQDRIDDLGSSDFVGAE